MNVKNFQNLLILLAIIVLAYLSFLIVEHYGYLVNGILSVSVIFLLYRINILPISDVAATVDMLKNIRNPQNVKGYLYIFFFAIIFSVAIQEIVATAMLVGKLLSD